MASEQEKFWAGDFGSQYIDRNRDPELLASNTMLFARIFEKKGTIGSALELGANIGLNLSALATLYPRQHRTAVEINSSAFKVLSSNPNVDRAHLSSISEASFDEQFDLVFCKGVLIHLNPLELSRTYRKIATWSKKYVLFAEYYSPQPVEIPYRGHDGKLFKRDFAGEFLDQETDFVLDDYGFVYRRDLTHAQDDINWFLMKRG